MHAGIAAAAAAASCRFAVERLLEAKRNSNWIGFKVSGMHLHACMHACIDLYTVCDFDVT